MSGKLQQHLRGALRYSIGVAVAVVVICGLIALIIKLSGTPPPSSIDSLVKSHSVGSVLGISALFVIIIPVLIVQVLHVPERWSLAVDFIALSLFWGAALYWLVLSHRTIKEMRLLKKLGLLPTRKLSGKEEYDRVLAEARAQQKALASQKEPRR